MKLRASRVASRGTLCPSSSSVCVWCGVSVVCVCVLCVGRTGDTATNICLVKGGAKEPQKWVPGMVRWCAAVGVFQGGASGGAPVTVKFDVAHKQIPMVLVGLVLFLDKVVDAPVALLDRCVVRQCSSCALTRSSLLCSSSSRFVQFLDRLLTCSLLCNVVCRATDHGVAELMPLLPTVQIVACSATDHGVHRGGVAAFACGADRGAQLVVELIVVRQCHISWSSSGRSFTCSRSGADRVVSVSQITEKS